MGAMAHQSTPLAYASLDPQRVLEALDHLGLHGDGRLLQLNSYENRVFQVHLEDGEVVVAKFYRPGRWSDSRAVLLGEPPTLAYLQWDDGTHRVSVSDRHAGRGPELEDPQVLLWLGRFLGRLHAVGQRRLFAHRLTLDVAAGHAARKQLLEGDFIPPAERGPWDRRCTEALALVEQSFAEAQPLRALRLHGDFHPGNIMWRDEGPHVVDLDDACNGPAVQDLWMLLSGDSAAMRQQLALLLEGYRVFVPFDERELALVEPLRTLRMIRHSAWIAERWSDPAFPLAFPWFASAGHWSQQATQLSEQIDAMRDPPQLS